MRDEGRCAACGQPAAVVHHDHGSQHGSCRAELAYWAGRPQRPPRFAPVLLCYSCNRLDAAAKRRLGLPPDFSFMPEELWLIREPKTTWPYKGSSVNLRAAHALCRVLAWRGLLPRLGPGQAPLRAGPLRDTDGGPLVIPRQGEDT